MPDQGSTLTIIGNHISPFVRKVIGVCEIKGLAYQLDSIVPFFGGDRFTALSPLRRIPVLIDGAVVLSDSSVICEYLDDKWPARPVLPRDPAARAQARWLDEFADTRISDVILWKVFGRALVGPAVFKTPRDLEAIQKTVAEDVPGVMDVLERAAPSEGFAFGAGPGLEDLSVASHFANYRWSRQAVDAKRWPRAAAWIARVEAAEPLRRLNAIGETILRVAPDGHRPALEALGVRVTSDSVGGKAAQRGPMTVV